MRDLQKAIQEHKNKVLELYPEHQILGIFVYGSQNYNIATENSDVDTKAIIVPTLYNLAINPINVNVIKFENGEQCVVMDVRHLVANFRKQNINFVEILFTPYCWINPDYKVTWQIFFQLEAEHIATYNPQYCLKSICGQAIRTLKQDKNDAKKYANGLRLRYFLTNYFDKDINSYKDCIWLNEESFLPDYCIYLKTEKPFIETSKTDELIEWFKQMQTLEVFVDKKIMNEIDNTMNRGILHLIKKCEELEEDFKMEIYKNNN